MTIDWVDMQATALGAIGTVAMVLVGSVVGLLLSGLLKRWVRGIAERPLGSGRASLLSRAVHYAALFGVLVFVLSLLGVRFAAVATWLMGAAGIFGVALGFASQTSGTNIVSGLFLLGERPFDVGDFVEIDGVQGIIMSIDLMSIKLRTFDNVYVRVPNETAMKTKILNFSRFPIRRFEMIARFPGGVDVAEVETVLLQAAARDDGVLSEPSPSVFFQGIEEGQIELKLVAWASQASYFEIKTRFTVALVAALQASSLDIALPTSRVVLEDPARQDGIPR